MIGGGAMGTYLCFIEGEEEFTLQSVQCGVCLCAVDSELNLKCLYDDDVVASLSTEQYQRVCYHRSQ